jgi:integrase
VTRLARARFISLDSSLLANLSRDYYSRDLARQRAAPEFLALLSANGWTILICWHHFEELIRHHDDETASDRVRFIRSLPSLGRISTASEPKDIGSICDIFVCEVSAAFEDSNAGKREIGQTVKRELLRFGTGEHALKACGDSWYELRSALQQRAARLNEISSISQAQTLVRADERPIASLLGGAVRTANDARGRLLFQQLPDHLAQMALFKVNTGCREQEVCGLRWDYEVKVPELDTSVFIIPGERVKNGDERLVVLNRVAKSVIEGQRGKHPTHVFVQVPKEGEPKPVGKINKTGWKSARQRAADQWEEEHGEPVPEGFRRVRVHDLKHTFGRSPASRRRVVRRSPGPARTPERPYHDALLASRAEQPDRGGGEGLRRRKVPQSSRNHLATSARECGKSLRNF